MRLSTLTNIRWMAVFGQSLTLVAVYWGFGFQFDLVAAAGMVAASMLLNLYLRLSSPPNRQLSEAEATLQLGFDLMQLSALIYLTGGLTNPFCVLLLVPVTISATVLSRRYTAILLITALVLSVALAAFHRPLPWSTAAGGPGFEVPPVYQFGLWIGLAVAMTLLALYASRVSVEARQRARALAATQAALAREQRLSALGSLAAAAAHELGTPLGTITLAARDLVRDTPPDDPRYADLALINGQAERCREILEGLARRSGDPDDPFSDQPIEALVREAARPYEETSPVTLTFTAAGLGQGAGEQPVVARMPEIIHGLGNLIGNAMDFARRQVRVDIGWDDAEIRLTIRDDGPGFDPAIIRSLGEPYVTTRRRGAGDGLAAGGGGMGLGIFIAKTLLERTGAGVSFVNSDAGGAVVRVGWRRTAVERPVGEAGRVVSSPT